MNKVLLVGRLTKDPELRTTPGGIAVTRFTIAVSQNYVNKSGERGTDFINCSAWGRQADNISKYCRKGSLVSAEGRIRTSNYDAQDGTKRFMTEVVCDTVNFLSSRTVANNSNNDTSSDFSLQENDFMSMPMETADLTEDPFKSFGEEITLSSDDLPF